MSVATVVRYTKADFDKIQMDGFSYTLSPATMKIIQEIANQVGSPEYIKTPQFEKRDNINIIGGYNSGGNNNKHRKNKPQELNDEDWNSLRNFPTTVINKKAGIDAAIDQIRKHLNKMTTKTYESLKEKIFEEIDKIKNYDDQDSELVKIGEAIFNIASGNSFFSSMYAELFKELMEKFNFMRVIFDTNFEKFRSIFNTIDYCDPNTDYDKFCVNNKLNEQRRAISLFYVNLMIQEVIEPSKIIAIIRDLQDYMNTLIVTDNNKTIVDELTEVLYILITNSYDVIKNVEEDWSVIFAFVKTVSEMKPATINSVSNKTVFKHMDMLDVI
uniref:MIF4G domain-containing protein n=1 Tax=viral metagenome TaxID=1070528 RepID=A0A6C0HFP3_9ZZZZ